MSVHRRTLSNGLEILVYRAAAIPWVSLQLWYRVGSKHESDGQRGAAHILEHMLFKGTSRLSEVDVSAITHKFSGYCNAFTSQDFTGYIFDFPQHVWTVGLDLLADCMRNGTIKADLLHTELGAVIQELRLYRDDYHESLQEMLIADVYTGHPYHHPIIGYRSDIWDMKRDALLDFYRTWYVPNNAMLVVVGDVAVADVYTQAEHFFGDIRCGELPNYESVYNHTPLGRHEICMYREVAVYSGTVNYIMPGLVAGKERDIQALCLALAQGKVSRLYKKLVLDKAYATHVDASVTGMLESSILSISFTTRSYDHARRAQELVLAEGEQFCHQPLDLHEAERITNILERERLLLTTSTQECASALAQSFIATGDAGRPLVPVSDAYRSAVLQELAANYMRPTLGHTTLLCPLTEKDAAVWQVYQESYDREDEAYGAERVRSTPLENPKYVHKLSFIERMSPLPFPDVDQHLLANGCSLLVSRMPTPGTMSIIIQFPITYYHEPTHKQGITLLMLRMLSYKTVSLSAYELACELERCGMSLSVESGFLSLSCMTKDVERALHLLAGILREPCFDEASLKQVQSILLAEVTEYWDDPFSYVDQRALYQIYGDHPYGRPAWGTLETLSQITLEDIRAWYLAYGNLCGARCAITGDVPMHIMALAESALGTMPCSQYELPSVPLFTPLAKSVSIHERVARDQTVLCYVGASCARKDTSFQALALADQIICGGDMNSMYSLLFQVRERTGLFYTVQGSLVLHADVYPGVVRIKTLVNPENVAAAQQAIEQVLATAAETLSKEALEQARCAILSAAMQLIVSPYQYAKTILFFEHIGLPRTYCATLAQELAHVTLADVRKVIQQYLAHDRLACITIGR